MDLLWYAREINIPQCRWSGGCIISRFGMCWPEGHGRDPEKKRLDLIYFDKLAVISEGAGERAIEKRSVQRRLPAFRHRLRYGIGLCAPMVRRLLRDLHISPAWDLQDERQLLVVGRATHAVGFVYCKDDQFDVFAPFGFGDISPWVIRFRTTLSQNRATP